MEVKLIVVDGKNAGKAIKVPGSKFLIGRADDCQLRPRSDLVSRHHCAILVEDGYVGVRDFGSKNGTLVNGEKVVAERELKTGDRLVIGTSEFQVEVTVEVSGQKKPEVRSVEEAASRTVESAQSSADDEESMDDWLGLDDDDDEAVGSRETAVLSASETDTNGPSPEVDSDSPTEAAADESSDSKPADAEGKKQRIDAPEDPKGKKKAKKSKDTGSVAANVLQSFFTRRR